MFIKEISCTAILSVVTMSCMTINLNAPYIDYRLEPYVKSFIYEAKTYEVNKAKRKAATEWCADRLLEFKIITEDDLGIK